CNFSVLCELLLIYRLCLISEDEHKRNNPRPLTLDEYLDGDFNYNTFSPYWVSGKEYLHQSKDDVILHNVESGQSITILKNSTVKEVNATNYAMSADQNFILLESNYSKLWRYSYTASYHIYDLILGVFVKEYELPHNIQHISWSPVGHKLAYVYQNNIYFKQDPREAAIQITTNGYWNEIFNGIPDWVYEATPKLPGDLSDQWFYGYGEEMLATKYALWWSPNGKNIAYIEFNDTEIPAIEYSYYGKNQYPRKITLPYPKAGAKNPTVRVLIIDTTNPTDFGPKEVLAPPVIAASDHYVTWITWVRDDRICVQWLKRIQNFSLSAICDYNYHSRSWDCPENQQHIEESHTGWTGGSIIVSQFFVSAPYFTSDAISYYKIFSDQNGYKHIHYIKDSVEKAIQITSGEWEAIYIYRVTDDAIAKKQDFIQAMNLKVTQEEETFTSPGIPISTIYDNRYNKEIKVLEDNADLESALQKISLPIQKINKLEVDGITLWYKMLLPPKFDRSKKYPLLIQVYGGPCSQNVKHTFSVSWISYLASKEEIVVALVDGRGTAFQGDKMLHAVYRKLGVYEVEDQISAVR
ncbi:hypothetical protein Chor_015939, partial [Crotalus horridus]